VPELEDQGVSAGGESDQPGKEPGLYGIPPGTPSEPQPVPVTATAAGGAQEGKGSDDGDEIGGDKGEPDPVGGDGKATGGKVRRKGAGKKGGVSGLTIRSYAIGDRGNEYLVILRTQEEFTGAVRVVAACDEDSDGDLDLESCVVEGNGARLATSGNQISDVQVSASTPAKLRLAFKKPRRVALMLEKP